MYQKEKKNEVYKQIYIFPYILCKRTSYLFEESRLPCLI